MAALTDRIALTANAGASIYRNMAKASHLPGSQEAAFKFLFSDIRFLKRIGPARAETLYKHKINTVFDLLFFIPRKYLDRRYVAMINQLAEGETVTVIGEVTSFGIKYGRRRRFIVHIKDDTGHLELVWFSGYKYLENFFEEGDLLAVTGKIGFYDGYQMAHPELEVIAEPGDQLVHGGRIVPVYPGSASLNVAKLHSRGLRKIIRPAIDQLTKLRCETIPARISHKYDLLGLSEALAQVHFPDSIEAAERGLNRLAFEELFYLELLLAARHRKRITQEPGYSFPPPKRMGRQLLNNLNFKLTTAQKRVLREIYADAEKPHPMNRLLQGDVGSGKTVVALLAMLAAVEAGYQAALMAPTEILAEQHGFALRNMLEGLKIKSTVFTGSVSSSRRKAILNQITNGQIDILIGTHTLIQDRVKFEKLGLVVIDEQHKFGVVQREKLKKKGLYPDTLVMTATPIPRTLAMTFYGDLDVSIIDEMPPGRIPVKTSFVPSEKRRKMFDFIKHQIGDGRQVYIVYPLVEESEKMDLKAAVKGYESLQREVFPEYRLALLHGRMKGDVKNQVMVDFKDKKTDIIVATTVVEVGLDVPNASIMVIENSERFGLSQLHQLRGRIGRGPDQSFCFLLSDARLSEAAEKRINILCSTHDGFKIAEADMALRGPGEIMGTRQHGLPELKVAKLTDAKTLTLARDCAFEIIAEDEMLMSAENKMLRQVLINKFEKKIQYSKIA